MLRSPDAVTSHTVPSGSTRPNLCGSLTGPVLTTGAAGGADGRGPDGCDDAWLQDAASRCALSGGQWRNVVVHARLLALRSGGPLGTAHVQAALAREYRKIGGTCPMRAADPRLAAGA